jgi:hypothetical protein
MKDTEPVNDPELEKIYYTPELKPYAGEVGNRADISMVSQKTLYLAEHGRYLAVWSVPCAVAEVYDCKTGDLCRVFLTAAEALHCAAKLNACAGTGDSAEPCAE